MFGGGLFGDGGTTSRVVCNFGSLILFGSLDALLCKVFTCGPVYIRRVSGVLILFNPGTSPSLGILLGCGSSDGGGGGGPTSSSSSSDGGDAFIIVFGTASTFAFPIGGALNAGTPAFPPVGSGQLGGAYCF